MVGNGRTAKQRGFTLVELLAVVVMVGVLATLAVFAVRKYVFVAKASEAYSMITAIRAAEEAYRDETFAYLDVTGAGLQPLYPNATPNATKWHWKNPANPVYAQWERLGVDSTTAVQYGYAVTAGTGACNVDPGTEHTFNWPATNEPWYVVVAVGDRDEDGIQSRVVASSFTSELYVEHEEE